MKIEEIRELAQIMKENGLGILELQEDGTNLRMEAASAAAPAAPAVVPVVQAVPAAAPVQAAPAAPAPAASAAPVATQDGTPVDFNNLKEVKSPMVGVFYQAPSPEANPSAAAARARLHQKRIPDPVRLFVGFGQILYHLASRDNRHARCNHGLACSVLVAHFGDHLGGRPNKDDVALLT